MTGEDERMKRAWILALLGLMGSGAAEAGARAPGTLAVTLAGVAHNAIGWAIRGRGTADTVGPQAADAACGP